MSHRLDAAIAELEAQVSEAFWMRHGGLPRGTALLRSYIAALRVLRRERDKDDRIVALIDRMKERCR